MNGDSIQQGDIFWIDLGEPLGSDLGYRRPCVVIQNNLYNTSRLNTVVVCLLTTNLRLRALPGNVYLSVEDTGLSKPSVANITQVVTVDKSLLKEKVGAIPYRQTRQILEGVVNLLRPREI